jgi:hypothetical protein
MRLETELEVQPVASGLLGMMASVVECLAGRVWPLSRGRWGWGGCIRWAGVIP